jgi:predicted NUDIX family phosphoesterase
MAEPSDEHVMVVPASVLDRVGRFQGFCSDVKGYLTALLDKQVIRFLPRRDMEEDPGFKQIIPYCLLRYGQTVFRYTRGKKMGEKRLHALESIGVGGHISRDDARPLIGGAELTYEEAMHRELDEEVSIHTTYREQCVGLINDDSTPVGQVHLGVVHLFDLEMPEVRRREAALAQAGFVSIDELRRGRERLETWSQICVDALFA